MRVFDRFHNSFVNALKKEKKELPTMVIAHILDGYFQKDSGWLFSKIKLINEINSAYTCMGTFDKRSQPLKTSSVCVCIIIDWASVFSF